MSTQSTVDARNAEISRREVADFLADKPERYFAYWNARGRWYRPGVAAKLIPGDLVTTWTGDKLATLVWAGHAWTSNAGDRRQNFRAVTQDGQATYSGTAFLTAGDYVRMRKVKP